jgi:predicted glutamine amidotransferase
VSNTFVAHVRVATAGLVTAENTHPFTMDERIMAHNGGFDELEALNAELGDDLARVHGDTDSERYLALVTREIERHDGDVGAGITAAATWLSTNVPLFSLNVVLVTRTELWALRYPDHHRLYVLQRPAGGPGGHEEMRGRSDLMEVSSDHLARHRAVVVASEPMDEQPGWDLMASGELLRVGPDLTVERSIVLPDEPTRRTAGPLPYVP